MTDCILTAAEKVVARLAEKKALRAKLPLYLDRDKFHAVLAEDIAEVLRNALMDGEPAPDPAAAEPPVASADHL